MIIRTGICKRCGASFVPKNSDYNTSVKICPECKEKLDKEMEKETRHESNKSKKMP